MLRVVIVFAWLAVGVSAALAQSPTPPLGATSRPVTGGVGVAAPQDPLPFAASGATDILRHRGPTGSPCLEVGGFARPHTIDPNLYDHVITATNKCPQRIVMTVCYYNSQDCIPMEIQANERKQAILGTLPGEKDFRFEFREKF